MLSEVRIVVTLRGQRLRGNMKKDVSILNLGIGCRGVFMLYRFAESYTLVSALSVN